MNFSNYLIVLEYVVWSLDNCTTGWFLEWPVCQNWFKVLASYKSLLSEKDNIRFRNYILFVLCSWNEFQQLPDCLGVCSLAPGQIHTLLVSWLASWPELVQSFGILQVGDKALAKLENKFTWILAIIVDLPYWSSRGMMSLSLLIKTVGKLKKLVPSLGILWVGENKE